MKIVDLTHVIKSDIPTWGGGCGFHLDTISDYHEGTDVVQFRVQKCQIEIGLGTHMDAPAHCIIGGTTIDQQPVEIIPAIKIDVSHKAYADYVITLDDLKEVMIPEGSFVLFYTGWDRFWDMPDKYRNDLQFPFPYIASEVAEYLITKDIKGIGIDTLSPDGDDSTFPVHRIILGAGKYIIENVANGALLPSESFNVLVSTLKIEGATESPVTLLGLLS